MTASAKFGSSRATIGLISRILSYHLKTFKHDGQHFGFRMIATSRIDRGAHAEQVIWTA